MRIGSRLIPKLVAGEAGTNNETEISYGRVRWQTHLVFMFVFPHSLGTRHGQVSLKFLYIGYPARLKLRLRAGMQYR